MEDTFILILSILNLFLLLLIVFLLYSKYNKKQVNSDKNNDSTNELLNFSDRLNKSVHENQLANAQMMSQMNLEIIKEINQFKFTLREDNFKALKDLTENINNSLDAINKKVEERLSESFEKTNKSFAEIVETMNKIETAKEAINSLSSEVSGLQNILSNNQSRGAFGEFQLNQILGAILGEEGALYATQYSINEELQNQVRADAVVFLENPKCLLCIDSKFPYSSYSQYISDNELTEEKEKKLLSGFALEVKKHIKDISSKYVKKGITTDYALMFVPSDGILALLHAKLQEIIENAYNNHVIIVSPTTLAPTLFSYKVMILDAKRNNQAKEITALLEKLAKDFRQFGEIWGKIKKNLEVVSNQTQMFDQKVERIERRFEKITNIDFTQDEEEEILQLADI